MRFLDQAVTAHDGFTFQIVGDSYAVAFHNTSDALEAALDIQRALYKESWSPAPIKVRIGIHSGAAQLEDASKSPRYSGYTTTINVTACHVRRAWWADPALSDCG